MEFFVKNYDLFAKAYARVKHGHVYAAKSGTLLPPAAVTYSEVLHGKDENVTSVYARTGRQFFEKNMRGAVLSAGVFAFAVRNNSDKL